MELNNYNRGKCVGTTNKHIRRSNSFYSKKNKNVKLEANHIVYNNKCRYKTFQVEKKKDIFIYQALE